MINLVVYLQKEKDPVLLVKHLLEEKLIAFGSIDEDNNAFTMVDNVMTKQVNYVVSMQTQALHFNEIVAFIEKEYGTTTAMYASPIVGCNDFFDGNIRNKTKRTNRPLENDETN